MNLINYSCRSVLLIAFGTAVSAQTVSVPKLGFVLDKTAQALRPVDGITGAALIGDLVPLGFPVRTAVFSFTAAAGTDDRGNVFLLRDGKALPLAGAMRSPDLIVFSPSGASLLLGNAEAGQLQTFRGRELTGELAWRSTAAAVSDDGSVILARADDGIYILRSDTSVRIAPDISVTAFDFRPASHEAVLAAETGELYELSEALEVRNTAAKLETGQAVSVRWSTSGARLFVASANGRLTAVDVETGLARTTDCGCQPNGLIPAGNNLFRITDPNDLIPVQLLDGSGPELRVWFIPVPGGRL